MAEELKQAKRKESQGKTMEQDSTSESAVDQTVLGRQVGVPRWAFKVSLFLFPLWWKL